MIVFVIVLAFIILGVLPLVVAISPVWGLVLIGCVVGGIWVLGIHGYFSEE